MGKYINLKFIIVLNTFNFQIEKFNNVTVYMWCSLISSLFENLTNCLFNIIFKFTDHNAFAFVQLEQYVVPN